MESLPTEDQPPPTQVSIQYVSVVEENTSVKVVADTQVSSPFSSVLEDNTSVSDALEALNFDTCSVGSTIFKLHLLLRAMSTS
ncbi:hypothetical protein JTE90_009569 [Oedothorax gibbosus]|uniref:Uncharacterized protein n=1 Tax=Oedothorax gibbosus TaxID=931172 RepID=A0AAV6TJS3_9ARAC|nr:hypothetical protein JTE90_009569 [Oedothorax gibbosus]